MKEKSTHFLKDFDKYKFQDALISWFQEEKRDLPWRKTKDPYKVWVSEVMLQQTRVDTVIPYFERFMEKYPTLEDLAEADEQELLKIWEGLGYYSRVRNLQSAAKEVKETYGGVVPDTRKEFQSLKGVGAYTAGAVLSIAYGKPEHAVDGNVMRVLSRIFSIDEDISKAKTKKLFEEIVTEIISEEDPSSFNQGLMELGALVCTPKKPACLLCPVREFCTAFEQGIQEELPIKKKQKNEKVVELTAAVLRDDEGRILIRKRPSEGLLANLWEFPNEAVVPSVKNELSQFEKEMKEKHDLNVQIDLPLTQVKHIFSHLKWEIRAYTGTIKGNVEETDSLKLVTKEELEAYPLPVPHQKIWKSFLEYEVDA